jgi:AraC-like DNA-binding protein
VAVVHVDAGAGTAVRLLPSDLFAVAVPLDDTLRAGIGGRIVVAQPFVATLRTSAQPRICCGRGFLAVALLSPLGMVQAFGHPLHGVRGQPLPLSRVVGAAEATALRDRLRSAAEPELAASALAHWLERRILERRHSGRVASRMSGTAMIALHAEDTITEVDRLAAVSGVTARQLQRDFNRWLGVPPSVYLRLVRLQRTLAGIVDGVPLAELAHRHGYFDQSHMSRELRELTGARATELRADVLRAERTQLRSAVGRVLLLDAPRGEPETYPQCLSTASP